MEIEQKPGQQQLMINKPYRCRPNLIHSEIIADKLADLDGTTLLFFNLNDYSFIKSMNIIQKQDQYCAKLCALSEQFLIIFGMNKFIILSIKNYQVVEKVQTKNFIENISINSNYVTILSTQEDGQMRLINCWKINPQTGKIDKKYNAVQFLVPEFEDCEQDNLAIETIMSIESLPKVYIYWKNTNHIVEIDPIKSLSMRFSKSRTVSYIVDIDIQTYAEISNNKIYINSKKEGKQIAQLMSQQQKYHQIISVGKNKQLYTLSDKGIKKWQLTSNSEPILLTQSEKYPMEKIFICSNKTQNEDKQKNNMLVALNTQTKYIVIWQGQNQCKISYFPNQIVKKILKINETQACLLLEANATTQQQDQHKVSKYNKMEIYDFIKDTDIAKKGVLKFEYQIDVNSAVVCADCTIRFILNQQTPEGIKKYIFRWSPFIEDKKKQIKKREVLGAKDFHSIKIYSFDRILALIKGKGQQTFSIFNKEANQKTQISLYDFNAKNIGNYDLNGQVKDVQMNENNQIYAINTDRISIYTIDTTKKNRLQKINQIQVTVSMIKPIKNCLLVRKEDVYLLYDKDFEFIMKEDVEKEDKDFRIFEYEQNSFILKTENSYTLWNIYDQEIIQIKDLPQCHPSLAQLINNKIIISDKWVSAYNIKDKFV